VYRKQAFLQKESEAQGWEFGYQFHQCKTAEKLPDNTVNYFFAITGKYLDSENTSYETEVNDAPSNKDRMIARSPTL